jgi:hypothetical protein
MVLLVILIRFGDLGGNINGILNGILEFVAGCALRHVSPWLCRYMGANGFVESFANLRNKGLNGQFAAGLRL